MFAYCNNSPVTLSDPAGCIPQGEIALKNKLTTCDIKVEGGGGAVVVVVAASWGLLKSAGRFFVATGQAISRTYASAKAEIYEMQQALRDELAALKKKVPHVHHIVPHGKFSRRSDEVRRMLEELHDILKKAGINRFTDEMNLMLVSSEIHASLHTDAYIAHVYSYISAAGPDKEAIYAALFYLRLEIAAKDSSAIGY